MSTKAKYGKLCGNHIQCKQYLFFKTLNILILKLNWQSLQPYIRIYIELFIVSTAADESLAHG